jgi:hypothetical protein
MIVSEYVGNSITEVRTLSKNTLRRKHSIRKVTEKIRKFSKSFHTFFYFLKHFKKSESINY